MGRARAFRGIPFRTDAFGGSVCEACPRVAWMVVYCGLSATSPQDVSKR